RNRYETRTNPNGNLDTRCVRVDIQSAAHKHISPERRVLPKGFLPLRFRFRTFVRSRRGTSVNEGHTSMVESPEVMNIRQASQYLGVSADTLYKYVYEERIPAFKLGNRWKFKKTILDSWMERKSTQGEGKGRKKSKAARAAAGS